MSEKKIVYGSQRELDKDALANPKNFEGGRPATDISAWAKKMKEKDPDGEKADKIAAKYRKEK